MIEYILVGGLVGLFLVWQFRGRIFTYDPEQTPDCDEPYTLELICPDCGLFNSGMVYVHGQNEHEILVECTTCGRQDKIPKGVTHRLRLWYSQLGSDDR